MVDAEKKEDVISSNKQEHYRRTWPFTDNGRSSGEIKSP